jgi:hypothetical protein
MIRFDILLNNYTGLGTTIAIIDIWDTNDTILHNVNKSHGELCENIIKQTAPKAKIIHFDISEYGDRVTEESIIKALDKILNYDINIDIINISIGLDICSSNLHDACKAVLEKGTLIVAAKRPGNLITFPADIDGVISVEGFNESNEMIVEIYDHEFIVNNNRIPLIKNYGIKGNSFACAYSSAIISLLMESRPFIKKKDVLKNEYEENKTILLKANSIDDEKDILKKIPKNTSLIFNDVIGIDVKEIVKYVYKNITEVFESLSGEFISTNIGNKKDHDCHNILRINPYEYPQDKFLWDKANSAEQKIFIGEFSNSIDETSMMLGVDYLNSYSRYSSGVMDFDIPTIAICGFGCNSYKFPLSLKLFFKFSDSEYVAKVVTHNPMGVAFNFYTYRYDKSINFPETIFSINNELVALSKAEKQDIFIIDMPDSIGRTALSKLNETNFGQYMMAYMNAISMDIIIFTIPVGTPVEEIYLQLEYVKSRKIVNIFLFISPIMHMSTEVPRDFIDFIKPIDSMFQEYKFFICETFKEYPVYSELDYDSLFSDILNIF